MAQRFSPLEETKRLPQLWTTSTATPIRLKKLRGDPEDVEDVLLDERN